MLQTRHPRCKFQIMDMTAKLATKATFTPDVFADLWQWGTRKRAPRHNRRSISCQVVSVWFFFLVVMKILLLTCQRYMISMWGSSEQSLPPLLSPEASSRLGNNGILAIVYPSYRTTCPECSMSSKLGNSLTAFSMGCILERVCIISLMTIWRSGGLTTHTKTEERNTNVSSTSVSLDVGR